MTIKVNGTGRLGADPEFKQIDGDKCVVNFSVGYDYDKEHTEWLRCVAWGNRAKYIRDRVQKGTLVRVEGKLKTDKWTDNKGVERYTTKLVITEFEALAGLKDSQNNSGYNQAAQQQAPQQMPQQQAPQQMPQQQAPQQAPQQASQQMPQQQMPPQQIMDDDIPF